MTDLLYLKEPELLFNHEQSVDDPRDGLMLFGPLERGKPAGIRSAVIGTAEGIRRFKRWHSSIIKPVYNQPASVARPFFPGFEAAFRCTWNPEPVLSVTIDERTLSRAILIDDGHRRVYEAVNVYLAQIEKTLREEDVRPDVWCVIVPDDVRRYCSPRAVIDPALRITTPKNIGARFAKQLHSAPSLFPEENALAKPYQFEVNFHNQLKARLLKSQIPIQVIRESTIAPFDFLNIRGKPKRDLSSMLSDIAWHISTAMFYKSGGRPWKLAAGRPGVCYLGIVFKMDESSVDPRSACCAAQMFLDSGDGVVFKGAVGPWYNPQRGAFHLSRHAARELASQAVRAFLEKTGYTPKEIFLHGRIRFSDTEWSGFCDAAPEGTRFVGVTIKPSTGPRLYSTGKHAVLRGLAYQVECSRAYLWTRGFVPRLQTYPGLEVPRPLEVSITHGTASIETVLNDILALTKLNYNACRFADGFPVTLKFANAVGEILTAGPIGPVPPLPFKFYI